MVCGCVSSAAGAELSAAPSPTTAAYQSPSPPSSISYLRDHSRKNMMLSWPYPALQACSGSRTGLSSSSTTQCWWESDPGLPVELFSAPIKTTLMWLCAYLPHGWTGEAPEHSHPRENKQRCREQPYRGGEHRPKYTACEYAWGDPSLPGVTAGEAPETVFACVHSSCTAWTCLAPKRRSLFYPRIRTPTAAGDCRHLWAVTFLLSALSPWCYLRQAWLLLLPLVHLWCPAQQLMGLTWLSMSLSIEQSCLKAWCSLEMCSTCGSLLGHRDDLRKVKH